MSKRKEDPLKFCVQCENTLKRKTYGREIKRLEYPSEFAKRQFCDKFCQAAYNAFQRQIG